MAHDLLRYVYLDAEGIEGLYAQTVKAVETSRTLSTQRGRNAKLSVGLKLKNLFAHLTGIEAEGAGEVGRSRTRTLQSTKAKTVEHKIQRVISVLERSTEVRLYTNLGEACSHVRPADQALFVNVRDTFNAPQFYGGAKAVDSLSASGYLLLEKYGETEYYYSDEYYKLPKIPVKLHASLSKMRTGSFLSTSNHETAYFHGYSGRDVPLGVFGALSSTPQFFQIKPYAIWR
jgi:hypothetical protein